MPCQCTQMRLPSDTQSWCIPALLKIRKPTRADTHKQLPSKTHFHHCSMLLVSAFETNQPRTLLQASTDHQKSTSVFRRGLPTIHHTSQPIPSTVLGAEPIADGCLACLACGAKLVSNVSCDPWSARNSPLPETLPHNASRNGVSRNTSRCPQLTDTFRYLSLPAFLGRRLPQTPFAPSVCLLVCSSPCPAS